MIALHCRGDQVTLQNYKSLSSNKIKLILVIETHTVETHISWLHYTYTNHNTSLNITGMFEKQNYTVRNRLVNVIYLELEFFKSIRE